jgi:hypothetical protein
VDVADVHAEIDRLERDGVRFSIAMSGDGFVVRVGDYLNGHTPSREVPTVEEAVRWVSTFARQQSASHISPSA